MFDDFFDPPRRDPLGRVDTFEGRDDFALLRNRNDQQSTQPFTDLTGGVGRGQRNERNDVARVEILTERNGKHDLDRTDGPTGIFSLGLERAVMDFQDERDLKRDGIILPRGETIEALSGGIDHSFVSENEPASDIVLLDDEEPDCSGIEAALEEAEARLAEAQARLDAAQDALEPVEAELEERSAQLEEAEAKISALQGQLDSLQEQIRKEEEEARKKAGDIGKRAGQVFGGLIGVGVSRNIPGGIKGGSKGGKAGDGIGQTIADVVDRVTTSDLEKKAAELTAEIEKLDAEIEPLRAAVEALEAQVEPLSVAVEQASQAVDEAQARVQSLQADLEACQGEG